MKLIIHIGKSPSRCSSSGRPLRADGCQPAKRKGVVLLVVLALLALFSVVGLTFVFFSEQESAASRLNVDVEKKSRPDPDVMLAFILNQLMYDTKDEHSYLRGHSLLRNVHGRRGNQPFNGTGKLHTTDEDPSNLPNDLYYLLNFTGAAGSARDPDDPNSVDSLGSFNPPYTYPDHNAPWLGAIASQVNVGGQAYNNVVIARSFVRVGVDASGNFFNPYDVPNTSSFWTDTSTSISETTRRRLMVVRPRPADQGRDAGNKLLFPPPADRGGDVKCLPPGTHVLLPDGTIWQGNDSYWLDPNFPVQVGPDGKRYKMLVAFFIMDLDGKLNLNMAFNMLGGSGGNPQHVSNQGHGPWEIGLPPFGVVSDEFALFVSQFPNLLAGQQNGKLGRFFNPSQPAEQPVPGRFGQSVTPAPSLTGPAHAKVDALGYDLTQPNKPRNDLPTFSRQTDATAPDGYLQKNWYAFPHYPAGYENGNSSIWLNHPALHNGVTFTGDRKISAAALDLLYRMGDTGTDALTSDLMRLFPFPPPNNALTKNGVANRLRWMLTTDSADAAHYGFSPRKKTGEEDTANSRKSQSVMLASIGRSYPAIPLPPQFLDKNPFWDATIDKNPLTQAPLRPPFVPTFTGQRFDLLNKPYTKSYPPPGANGRIDLATSQIPFLDAVLERQQRAKQIYLLLVELAGIQYPASGNTLDMTKNPEFDIGTGMLDPAVEKALKDLAQTAVNIVDFSDPDDYITPFNWGNVWGWSASNPTARLLFTTVYAKEWVYGTEMPRVLINEVYAEYKKTAPDKFEVKVWTELFNPLDLDPYYAESGAARLQVQETIPGAGDQYGAYQLVLASGTAGGTVFTPNDPKGELDASKINMLPSSSGGGPAHLKDWGSATGLALQPNNRNWNQGWSLVGKENLPEGAKPDPPLPPVNVTSPKMIYEEMVPVGAANPEKHLTVVLRRLACPYLPEDSSTASPTYNPFITVDYMATLKFDDNDQFKPNDVNNPVAGRQSVGRRQPLHGATPLRSKQTPDKDATTPAIDPLVDQPQHSFGRHNSVISDPNMLDTTPAAQRTLQLPFDWLVHLDRPLISPIELLHVSTFKPHELTQEFMKDVDPPGTINESTHATKVEERFQHTRNWLPKDITTVTRLYRLFDFVECQPFSQWDNAQPVRPGKLNLNTIYDREIFLALADFPSGTVIQSYTGGQIWNAFRQSRDGISWTTPTPRPLEGRPFSDPSAGNRPLWGSSIDYNLPTPTPPTQFATPSNGRDMTSVRQHRLIYPNPLRNNQPEPYDLPVLGLPVGADGQNTDHPWERYQLLSKIANNATTRSNVFAVWMTVGFFEVTDLSPTLGLDTVNVSGSPVTATIRLRSMNGKPRARTGTQVGDFLIVDSGLSVETVEVLAVNTVNNTITAQFQKSHEAPFAVNPTLKEEIGRADGRHVRHRFFAIVDRSPLIYWVAQVNEGLLALNQPAFDVGDTDLPIGPGSVAPLLGNPAYDPRRDYTQAGSNIGNGPPPCVLYWTIIE